MKKIFAFFSKYLFTNISVDFAYLFFKKEGRVLMGKNFSNFIFLLIIFLITFFALGFAKGSLRYLNEKMNDPFIKWVSIDIPYVQADELPEIMRQLKEDTLAKKKYKYRSVTGYRSFSLRFWDVRKNDAASEDMKGRTIDLGNPMLKVILKDSNLIYGREFLQERELGLIVTSKLLKKLGYEHKSPYLIMAFPDKSTTEDKFREVPLPIIAVVRELPGKNDFFATTYFFQQRQMALTTYNPFDPTLPPGIAFLTIEKDKRAHELKDKIKQLLKEDPKYNHLAPIVDIQPYDYSFFPCYQINVGIKPDTSVALRDRIYHALANDKKIRGFSFTRYADYTTTVTMDSVANFWLDKLVVEFTSLDKLKDFNDYLQATHKMRIDMGQVKALENYNFISNLTQIISIILMIFSVLSIILFLTNLLRNHLDRIKMNIGTFKAFGIHHRSLEKIYLSIIFSVILIAIVISYVVNMTVGSMGAVRLVLILFKSPMEAGENYFDLVNQWTITSLILILVASYFALKHTTRKIFTQSPGDLIYDRQDSGTDRKAHKEK